MLLNYTVSWPAMSSFMTERIRNKTTWFLTGQICKNLFGEKIWGPICCFFTATGIEVTLPDGVKTRSKVMALSGHFDLPARAGVLEQVTYTGHDSCSYCEEHGDVVKTGARGHVMTFPFRNTISGHAELRTAHNVEAHSYSALEQNTTVSMFTTNR